MNHDCRNAPTLVNGTIARRIGTYRDYEHAAQRLDQITDPQQRRRVISLGVLALQVQWVTGDARKAENSFLKINQSAAEINDAELMLLKSRKKANAIAARAIIRSGKGHKYWSKFAEDKQQQIEKLAEAINEVFFEPELRTPIRTLDLPIGGKVNSSRSLAMVLEFVNIVNKIKIGQQLPDDVDGEDTIEYLKQCKRIIERINSNHPSSLGLHPAIYFYSRDGQHKTTSLYAVTSLILDFDNKTLVDSFISTRANFEGLLKNHDYIIQQIWRHYRGGTKAYEHIKNFYLEVIKRLSEGKDNEKVLDEIIQSPDFNFLVKQMETREGEAGKDFTKNTKSAAYIRDALDRALQCKICSGLIHVNATHVDHVERKSEGGTNALDNAQLSHPYCNTGFKN